jgi:hypothetical protein
MMREIQAVQLFEPRPAVIDSSPIVGSIFPSAFPKNIIKIVCNHADTVNTPGGGTNPMESGLAAAVFALLLRLTAALGWFSGFGVCGLIAGVHGWGLCTRVARLLESGQ